MKKILALILAAMMLLGGAAMATDMTEVVHVGSQEDFVETGDPATSASQSTDVWLQVEASGQIDVTVPLVVVFKTNIDGGSASTGNTYKIVNNSSAAIKVTEVKVQDQKTDVSGNGVTSNMTMVKELPSSGATYDQYTLTMKPTDHYQNKYYFTTDNGENVYTYFTDAGTASDQGTFVKKADAVQTQGLWRIERSDGAENGSDESKITLTLSTSKLSFVTNQKSVDNEDVENGVKLFNVAYTVKIDDSTAVGGDIKDETQNHSYSYAGKGN